MKETALAVQQGVDRYEPSVIGYECPNIQMEPKGGAGVSFFIAFLSFMGYTRKENENGECGG